MDETLAEIERLEREFTKLAKAIDREDFILHGPRTARAIRAILKGVAVKDHTLRIRNAYERFGLPRPGAKVSKP